MTRNKLRDPDLKWAKYTINDIFWMIQQTLKLYGFRMDQSDQLYHVRRKVCKSKKKKRVDFTQNNFKYSLEELQYVNRYLELDTERKDTKWSDSMDLEIDSLIDINCFELNPDGTEPHDS